MSGTPTGEEHRPSNGMRRHLRSISVGTILALGGTAAGMAAVDKYTPWGLRRDLDLRARQAEAHDLVGHAASLRRLDAVEAKSTWVQAKIEEDIADLKTDVRDLDKKLDLVLRQLRAQR